MFPSDRFLKGKELFDTIRVLVATAKALSEKKIGALIVIERKIGLNEHIESGRILDAEISQELLHTIFYDKTNKAWLSGLDTFWLPLHVDIRKIFQQTSEPS